MPWIDEAHGNITWDPATSISTQTMPNFNCSIIFLPNTVPRSGTLITLSALLNSWCLAHNFKCPFRTLYGLRDPPNIRLGAITLVLWIVLLKINFAAPQWNSGNIKHHGKSLHAKSEKQLLSFSIMPARFRVIWWKLKVIGK